MPRHSVDAGVFITGVGMISPLGEDAQSIWAALLAGRSIRDHARVPGYDKGSKRIHSLALSAARQALTAAGWTPSQTADAALIVGTSKGEIESWITPTTALPHIDFNPYVAAGGLPPGLSSLAVRLAHTLGIEGPRRTISAACSSGLHAAMDGAMLIRNGITARALVVAAEASIHPLFLGCFEQLGVLAPAGAGCRPFDRARCGFYVSEMAAAVCLETSGRPDSPRIERWTLGADAHHLTAPDPAGRALRQMLAQLPLGQVDMVHAHGTGTRSNDPVELAAIANSLSATADPAIYSHKAALGHSLGASGLVSLAINCLCHRDGMVPGNMNTMQAIDSQLMISSAPVKRTIRRSLILTAGFGGALGALSLCSG